MAAVSSSREIITGFSACPRNVVYSPALNCIIGTTYDAFIEVLDIHTGSILTKVAVPDDEANTVLHGMYCDDKDLLVIAKGQWIGCRGTLLEKILLDSILQAPHKGYSKKVKVELDIVQAGILINGLLQCKEQIDLKNHHATEKEQFYQTLKLLQKEYDASVQQIKKMDNKAVKWLTVCLEMDCKVLFSAINAVYNLMVSDHRGPALPIVGDILRRTFLLHKTEDLTRGKTTMLGEAERLQTFDIWPHMNYRYALPGPMAEAGFYHPTSSKTSEDRVMCFSCSVCLVCWEPSDQPWSEHERHSSSCPFVKGEYTENVPLNVCCGTSHGASIEREDDKIVCISTQDCNGLVAVGTKMGYLVVWSTYPVLKKHYEVRIIEFSGDTKTNGSKHEQHTTNSKGLPPPSIENDIKITSEEQQPAENTKGNGVNEIPPNNKGYVFPEVALPGDAFDSPASELDLLVMECAETAPCIWMYEQLGGNANCSQDTYLHENSGGDDEVTEKDRNEISKENACEDKVDITAVTLAKLPYKTNRSSEDEKQLFCILGLRRQSSTKKSNLLLYVHNITYSRLKGETTEVSKLKQGKFESPVIPEVGSTLHNPYFESEEDYDTGTDDSNDFSVIDEYLMVTQKHQTDIKQTLKNSKNDKKSEPSFEDFVQSIELPDNLAHSYLSITQLLVTDRFVIVVVNHSSDENIKGPGTLKSRTKDELLNCDEKINLNLDVDDGPSPKDSLTPSEVDVSSVINNECEKEPPLLPKNSPGEEKATENRDEVPLSLNECNTRDSERSCSKKASKILPCYIHCYSTAKCPKGNLLSQTPVASRKFKSNEIITDCLVVPYSKLASTTISEIHGNTSAPCSRESRFLFVGITGHENSIHIIEPFNLQTYLKVATPVSPDISRMCKIVFCSGLEVLTACFDDGKIWSCSLKGENEDVCESIQQEADQEVCKLFIDGDLNSSKLALLNEVTSSEPMVSRVHISVPMDWVFGKSTSFANSLLNGKKIRSHIQQINPVNGPARIKTHSLSKSVERTGGLKSTESTVVFKIFAAAETSIGYIDLRIECSCSITEVTDVEVTLRLVNGNDVEDGDGTNSSNENGDEKESKTVLLCHPLLLSDNIGPKDSIANLVLTSPKLISLKSGHFLVKLSQLAKVSESPFARETEQGLDGAYIRSGSSDEKVSRLCISDFITSIDVSVYQFVKVGLPWAPSCRRLLLQNEVFYDRLLGFLLEKAFPTLNDSGVSDKHIGLNVLMWIGNTLGNTAYLYREKFVSSIRKFIPALLRVCFIEGDRSLAHSCFEFLLHIINQSSKMQDDCFLEDLAEAIKNLLPSIWNSESIAAVRWFFRLTSTVGTCTQFENLFSELFSLLIVAAEAHQNGLTDGHMLLQSKYDVSGTPLEPILVEPAEIDLALEEASATVLQCNILNDNESVFKNSRGNKVFSLPPCDAPGLFEVQPLSFRCCSTSDGAYAEKFRTKKLKKSKCFSVAVKTTEDKEEAEEVGVSSQLWDLEEEKNMPFYSQLIPPPVSDSEYVDISPGNHFLQAENANSWAQVVKHGKTKKQSQRKKETFSSQVDDDQNLRNSFMLPDTMALVIRRMHTVSHHFVILDFQRSVFLTDILIPPCSSLGSISIVTWNGQDTENDAVPLVESEEIGMKALVLSDLRPPVVCQYLKITVVGARILNSTKVVIPLGQFYGYTTAVGHENSPLADSIKAHFHDCFCQYSLATDRLSTLLNESRHQNFNEDMVTEQVTKAYEDCSVAQFQLNSIVYYSRRISSKCLTEVAETKDFETKDKDTAFSDDSCNVKMKMNTMFSLSKVHQDFLRVIVECCLETLLLLIIDSEPLKGKFLDKDNCGNLFKSICIYGSVRTRQQGCLLVQCLCDGSDWWGEFLVSAFKYCFGNQSTIPMPKERLFPCFVRLIQNSQNQQVVYESFLRLLSSCIDPLITTTARPVLKNSVKTCLLDWVLLLLNELLQNSAPCSPDWTFLTPWDIIAEEKGSLEGRMYEGIRNYLHQRQHCKKNPQSNGSFPQQKKVSQAKKKYSSIHVVQDPQNVSNKLLKDLLQLRTHPALTRKGKPQPVAPDSVKRNIKQQHVCPIMLSQTIVVPVVKSLLLMLSRSNIIEHPECAVLACKVTAALCSTCQSPVETLHNLMMPELLVVVKMVLTGGFGPWVSLALTCLLKDFIALENRTHLESLATQQDEALALRSATFSRSSPTEMQNMNGASVNGTVETQDINEQLEAKGDFALLEELEGAASGIASSLASNLMKMFKERAPSTSEKGVSKETKNARVTSNLLTASYLSYPVRDNFYKTFATACRRKVLRDNKDIYAVLQEGLPSKEGYQHELENWDSTNKQGENLVLPNSSKFFNGVIADIISLKCNELDALELMIVLLDHGFSKKSVLSSCNIKAFQSWLQKLDLKILCHKDQNNVVLPTVVQLVQDFSEMSRSTGDEEKNLITDCRNLYLNMYKLSAREKLRTPVLLKSPVTSGEHTLLTMMLRDAKDDKGDIPDSKRIWLKQLLLQFLEVESFPQNLAGIRTFQLLMDNKVTLHDCSGEELNITLSILVRLSRCIREIMTMNADFLNMSWSYFSDKKVVFLLNKGSTMTAGKFGEEPSIKCCFRLLSLIETLAYHLEPTGEARGQEETDCKHSARYRKFFSNIIYSLNLFTQQHSADSKDSASQLLLQFPHSTKRFPLGIHPTGERLYDFLYTLRHCCQCQAFIVESFLDCIKSQITNSCEPIVISGPLKQVMLSLLHGHSLQYFLHLGGLSIIQKCIVSQRFLSTDTIPGSVIRNMLPRSQDRSQAVLSEKPEFRKVLDGCEVENFAPCAKITGPPQCTPAEVLLQSKSRHQRLRFAAWSYQYQQQDNSWISLTIEIPFVILLREIVVKMHPSFLGGCPSETIVQVAGVGSKLLPQSRSLPTSGLSVIFMEFAKGVLAKVVRLQFRCPMDSDSIRLNLIELYGSAALTETSGKPVDVNGNDLSPGVEILQHVLMESPFSFENFISSDHQAMMLARSLIAMLDKAPSLFGQRKIFFVIGKILMSLGENVFQIVDYVLSEDENTAPLMQTSSGVGCRLLYQVYRYTAGDVRIKLLHHLLKWVQILIWQSKGSVEDIDNRHLPESLVMVASILFLAMADNKELQLFCSPELLRLIVDCSNEAYEDTKLFKGLATLACAIISASPLDFSLLSNKCTVLMKRGLPLSNPSLSREITFIILSCMSLETSPLLLDTSLISKLLDEFQDTLTTLSSEPNIVGKVLQNLKIIDICAKSPYFVQRYGFKEKTKLWSDLIVFVCAKCKVTHYDENGETLKDLHALQSCALGVLRKLLTSNEEERRHFVYLLLDIISSKDVLLILASSFMKCIMLQLIIQEEEVTVVVGKNSGKGILDTDGRFLPDMVMESINFLGHKSYINMKLSDPLSAITNTLLKRTENIDSNDDTNVPPGVQDKPTSQPFEPMDVNMDGYALLVSSAKSVVDRRTQKGDKKSLEGQDTTTTSGIGLQIICPGLEGRRLRPEFTIGQVLQMLGESSHPFCRGQILRITYEPLQYEASDEHEETLKCEENDIKDGLKSLPTMLETFASEKGLAVLARQMRKCLDLRGEEMPTSSISIILKLLPLNGFAGILLQERRKAEYLLRLMLGVEENNECDSASTASFSSELHLLPFTSLKLLLDAMPIVSEQGKRVRVDAFNQGVITMILDQLALLSHCEKSTNGKDKQSKNSHGISDGAPLYWAKGTGFGTGSTVSTWNVEKAIQEMKREEEHIICLLQILISYLSAGRDLNSMEWTEEDDHSLPAGLKDALQSSVLVQLLSGYLRNDSVLDMANHIPLYHTVMGIMRALASYKFLHFLLLISNGSEDIGKAETAHHLLMKLNSCADTYMERLRAMDTSTKGEGKLKKAATKHGKEPFDPKRKEGTRPGELEIEELSILIKDIMDTAKLVKNKGEEFKALDVQAAQNRGDKDVDTEETESKSATLSIEDRYVTEMMKLQFDTYEIVGEGEDGKVMFNVPYHFATAVRIAITSGAGSSMRSRRLAQEVASLSTSLPISYGSCVIMRCDDSRLDVMKVLITGPEDTPYANGCFEFDIFFPTDYPASPVLVNLQTTGQHSVRFNPNLYNDGKVCLSILNTWHGRPEEKWNSTTSNLLQVLVSIQSLILVPEPYFNEPGYERMRNTPFGQQNSFSYNANIRQAVVRWGMIEQLRKPSPCFTEVIQKHFLVKKDAVIRQCEQWLGEMKEQSTVKKSNAVHYEALKNHFWTLKNELEKLEQGKLQVDIPSTSKENNPTAPSTASDYDENDFPDLEHGGPVAYL